jgi:hypothetical protein
MNKLFFYLFAGLLFVIERALQIFFNFPSFIFPVFAVLFILHSREELQDLTGIVVMSLLFDLFSGFSFGIYTFAIFAVCITIYFLKTRLNINARTFSSSVTLAVIFIFEFFLILSVVSSPRVLIDWAGWIIAETIVLVILLDLVLRKGKFLAEGRRFEINKKYL